MSILNAASERLAIAGGLPVRPTHRPWPSWPIPAPAAEKNIFDALHSHRWAIASPQGSKLYERRFAEEFARYTGTRHCVPVDHGASALVVALESLGFDYGDVVLVPSLTWTASASAALRAGLVPVLVDVDPVTGCIAPDAVAAAGVDARAVIAVHWGCTMADIPGLMAAATPRGTAVIEDAAQAHGGRWAGRAAGSMGTLGCFSFQHGKVLSAGEGGAVVTADENLALRLQELRADSRRYRTDAPGFEELELEETGTVQGFNYAMSEFAAALLCAQLQTLESQHDVRQRNFSRLTELLDGVEGVRLVQPAPQQTRMSIYEATLIFDPLPVGMTNADVAAALTAELGRRFFCTDAPLHRSPLLRPWTKPSLAPLTERYLELNAGRIFPNTDHIARHCVQTHHSTFLGDEDDMHDIADAVHKVISARF
jgi:dTDP-4-amino-4,6-dideoxygalactose transaminase